MSDVNPNSIIIGHAEVALDLLESYPDNPRRGAVEEIAKSLAANAQFRPLVVNQRNMQVLAGNQTLAAARHLEWQTIDVVYIDVDDVTAKRIVLADNRTHDLGGYDEIILANLLAEVQNEGDELLLGTGYTSDEVDQLLEAVIELTLPEEGAGESLGMAAALLDRIMPHLSDDHVSEDEMDAEFSSSTASAFVLDTVSDQPTEFVIFRLGELQAKIPRSTYETFIRRVLRENGGSLSLSGVAMAVRLGLPQDSVEPAVPHGAERWL